VSSDSALEVRQIDPADEMTLRASYDLERRALLAGREDSPHWSWSEMAAIWRQPDPGEDGRLYGGWVEGRMVAGAVVFMPLEDNTSKCWLGVAVDPAERGRGYGRALLGHVEAVAREHGRTELMAEMKLPFDQVTSHRDRRFAEAAGYDFANVEIVRYLTLPVPDADLDAWAAEAAERSAGYRLETFVNGVPDELLESMLVLHGQLAVDAPTGAVDWEEEVITPERWRANLESLLSAGRTMYETLAIADDGTVAAQTTIAVPSNRTDVSQWGTFVHREHRGHRLGLAVKAANLRAMQQAHPQMQRVMTQNAESNDYMVSINEKMGFEPVEAATEFVKRV
jgi:GNAT superfamily N-acetyltransferase